MQIQFGTEQVGALLRLFLLSIVLILKTNNADATNVQQKMSTRPDYVMWGTYCGECEGECATFYKADRFGVSIDKSQIYFKTQSRYKFSGVPAPITEQTNYAWVIESAEPTAFWKLPATVGKPDDHDQCGLILEISKNSKIKRIVLDPTKIPEEIRPYIRLLFGL